MDQAEETTPALWRRLISGGSLESFLVLAVLFILPLLVIPGSLIVPEIHKKFVLLLAVFLALIFHLIGRLSAGVFSFPKSFMAIAALAVLAATFLSSLFSPVKVSSLVGLGYEFGTLLSLAGFFVLFFLSAVIFQNIARLLKFGALLVSSFLIVSAVWLLNLFLGLDWLGLSNPTSTLIGGWNDFGIFAGLLMVVSLVLLESAILTKPAKIFLHLALLVGAGVLLVVNYSLLWWGLAGVSLAIFLQSFFHSAPGPKRFLKLSLLVFVISAVLALWLSEYPRFDRFIERLAPTPLEVRPSWSGTLTVVREILPESPIWGTGPNRFNLLWVKTRPAEVNQGLFWNIDFGEGVGHLPTLLPTGGLASLFFWLIFLATFGFYGLKAIVKIPPAHPFYSVVSASFWGTSFLWFFFVAYLPLSFVTALTFSSTGIFVALLVQAGLLKNASFLSSQTPTRGFTAVLAALILIILSVASLWQVGLKWRALVYFQRGFNLFSQTQNISAAEETLKKSLNLDGRDLYFRQMADVLTARLERELSEPGLDQETLRARFIATYGRILETVDSAKAADPTNYLNNLVTGAAYEISIPFGEARGYDLAKSEYQEAAKLNPTSPIVPHRLAQLELLVGNQETAKAYLQEALALKPNFTQSLLLLSQIEAGQGNLTGAIGWAERALDAQPESLDALFQSGVLYYQNKDWDEAISILEKTVSLQANYANAKYFLGLVYDRVGRRPEAIKIFEDLSLTNPDQANLKQILSNLKAGRPALTGLSGEQ